MVSNENDDGKKWILNLSQKTLTGQGAETDETSTPRVYVYEDPYNKFSDDSHNRSALESVEVEYEAIKSGVPAGYIADPYRGVSSKQLAEIIKERKNMYKDPKGAISSLMGLTTNRGLYGRILILKKNNDIAGYKIVFPRHGDMWQHTGGKEYYEYDATRHGYSDFLITGISMPQSEVASIEQGFGEYWDVHFYGKSPIRISVNGALLNAYDIANKQLYDWAERWFNSYKNAIRGTLVAKANARTYFIVGNYMFTGYILNTTQSMTAVEGNVPFAFSMVITSVNTFSEQAYQAYLKDLEKVSQGNLNV